MGKWRLPFLLILIPVVAGHLAMSSAVWHNRAQIRLDTPPGYVIPSKFSRVLSVGNRGLLSDFLFLKAATFFGAKAGAGHRLDQEEWRYFIDTIDAVTDLDPYFVDPYFLAEGLLAWDAGMPAEANRILEKGFQHRSEDYRLPFFIGFNEFYFMGDYAVAADWMMKAARLPGSPDYFSTLAARLAYYGGKSKTALLFLKQLIAESDNAMLRSRLEKRALALERAVTIEEALADFQRQEHRQPTALRELVTKGYLSEMPIDPYGGSWGVLKNGRVFSTSNFAEVPASRPPATRPVSPAN